MESDPGVFSELLRAFGARGVEAKELWSLDDSAFEPLGTIHGLLFLFKMIKAPAVASGKSTSVIPVVDEPEPWFARQVISNACGTLALLHVVLNARGVDVGPTLTNLREFTSGLGDPGIVGAALDSEDSIRTAHNSFARPEPFVVGERAARDDDDVYHFVAYIPGERVVWQLDGLQPRPVAIATIVPGQKWTTAAAAAIASRIDAANGSIQFNLIAVCEDRLDALQSSGASLAARARSIYDALQQQQPEACPDATPDVLAAMAGIDIAAVRGAQTEPASVSSVTCATESLRDEYDHVAQALQDVGEQIALERESRAVAAAENVRRRFNFVPLVMAALRVGADAGVLSEWYTAARERAAASREAARARITTADERRGGH